MGRSQPKKIVHSYKVWWRNPETHRKELTPYSDDFNTVSLAKKWYKNFGKALENMFNRKLVLTEDKIRKQ